MPNIYSAQADLTEQVVEVIKEVVIRVVDTVGEIMRVVMVVEIKAGIKCIDCPTTFRR